MMIKVDDPLAPVAEVLGLVAERISAGRNRVIDLRDAVTRELELHPFRTLAVAAGAGYLLAGGLFSRLTLRFISFGARLVVLPVIAAELAGGRREDDEDDDEDASSHRHNQRRARSASTITPEPQT
ncbi:MAG TPA: hypothetical protein VH560_17045 [Polyangia bacterium]|jgi:hypothetical protein|nr:hypothetical protein [Polyangia bacterium]